MKGGDGLIRGIFKFSTLRDGLSGKHWACLEGGPNALDVSCQSVQLHTD